MKKMIPLILSFLLLLSGCSSTPPQDIPPESVEETSAKEEVQANEVVEDDGTEEDDGIIAPYRRITPEDAKENLELDDSILLLDVRTEEEYNGGHIPGALLLPLDSISAEVETQYPDKEQTIYVYCRSGRRSEASAAILLDLGYENVYDLGGIMNWPYEME